MDLNEYIRQSYKRPNRKVLETLGASEDLIEYLMETPGNTNWNVLKKLNNINDDDDWTIIRLNTIEVEEGNYQIFTDNLVDVNNFKTLLTLEHPIIQVKYSIHSSYIETSSELGIGTILEDKKFMGDLFLELNIYKMSEDSEIVAFALPVINTSDYIEIKYKTTDSYHIINFRDSCYIYMTSGEKWRIPSILEASLTDGINVYAPGDIITVNSDMHLNTVE